MAKLSAIKGGKAGGAGKAPIGADDVRKTFPASTKKPAANDDRFDTIDIVEEAVEHVAENVIETADGALGIKPMLTVQFAPAVIGAGAGAVAWAGNKTGINAVASVGEKLQGGVKSFSEKTLAENFGQNRVGAAIGRGFTKVSSATGNLLSKFKLKSAAAAFEEMPTNLANTKGAQGVVDGAWVAGSALGMAAGGVGFFSGLSQLKRMAAEITGQKTSAWDILTGNVPEVVKAERAQLFKGLFATEASSGLSLGVAIKSLAKGGMSMPMMAVQLGIGIGASVLVGEGALPTYSEMDKAFKAGQQLPADAYAKLIGVASKELAARGENNPFMMALAEQYAGENASPALVMREIENGAVMRRVQAIIAANEAAKIAQPEQPELAAQAQQKSHVAALEKPQNQRPLGNLAQKERDILGDNTAKYIAQQAANNALSQAQIT